MTHDGTERKGLGHGFHLWPKPHRDGRRRGAALKQSRCRPIGCRPGLPKEQARTGDTTLKKKHVPRIQIAALPFRLDAEGRPEILLVTSRETKRWIIPKGWPMRGRKDHRAAEQEAFEEAGLRGRIGRKAIGHYRYDKRRDDGSTLPCAVDVYPLRVREERKRWPERKQRERRWYAAEEAAALVEEHDLRDLLRTFRGETDRALGRASG